MPCIPSKSTLLTAAIAVISPNRILATIVGVGRTAPARPALWHVSFPAWASRRHHWNDAHGAHRPPDARPRPHPHRHGAIAVLSSPRRSGRCNLFPGSERRAAASAASASPSGIWLIPHRIGVYIGSRDHALNPKTNDMTAILLRILLSRSASGAGPWLLLAARIVRRTADDPTVSPPNGRTDTLCTTFPTRWVMCQTSLLLAIRRSDSFVGIHQRFNGWR